ncbi:MAG: hypothetical protein JWM80_4546 [Cyanobacteria bacterium RYN_339]|nr:hypothetical protein [Cyanobacteria bacterium RYN_339]
MMRPLSALIAMAMLAGCQASALPAAAPVATTRALVGHVQPSGFRLAAAVAPWTLASVTRLVVVVYDRLDHEMIRNTLQGDIDAGTPIRIEGLAPDAVYTIGLEAYTGSASETLISLPQPSRTAIDMRLVSALGQVEDDQANVPFHLAFGDRPVNVTAHGTVTFDGPAYGLVTAHLAGSAGDDRVSDQTIASDAGATGTVPFDLEGLVPGADYMLTVTGSPPSRPSFQLLTMLPETRILAFTASTLEDLLLRIKDDEMVLSPISL